MPSTIMRVAANRTAAVLAACGSLALLSAAAPSASANWLKVSSTPSRTQPYYACSARSDATRCMAIIDPAPSTRARGPVAAGAITRGPVQEASPQLDGTGVGGGYSPSDIREAYELPVESRGSSQTVAIVDAFDDPSAEADLAKYRSEYALTPCTAANGCLRKVNQSGGETPPAAREEWASEISLDLDMVSAACPNCHILLVEASNASSADFQAAEDEAVALGANEISNSYGSQEALAADPSDAGAYEHPGIPITVAGGDNGYRVQYPAIFPSVISVGGTSLRKSSNARGWEESVWDDCTGTGSKCATGSGCSREAKPVWQTDPDCAFRTDNDVAAVADPNTPVSVYDSYRIGASGWGLAGGTSASAPIVAGAMALADEYTRSFEGAQALYLEAAANGTGALDDVITGSNGTCGDYLCEAGPGYDGPTGLGSLDGVPAVTGADYHPPTVLTEAASPVTQSSATLHASVDPNGYAVTRCSFEYGASGAYTPCAALPADGTSPVPVTASVAGLIPASTYSVRIVASNSNGTSYGATEPFTTPGSASSPFTPQSTPLPPGEATAPKTIPAPVPDARIAGTSLTVDASGAFRVRISCPGGESRCSGTVTLRTLHAVSSSASARVLVLASGSFAVAGGHTVTVKLRLSAKARRLLARSRTLRGVASIVARDPQGATDVTHAAVTLRAAGARRARRR